ncbi:MAG TPA: RidA family protein [Acidimicrobiales bacterium]|nr:RidA family protein [Acidimicrobiales bacterium]
MKVRRDPEDVHPPVATYAHQVEVRDERLLVLSGQIGMRVGGEVPDDPIEQLDVAWDNLDANLRAAGMCTGDLVKLTVYLVGDIDAGRRRALLARRLGDHRPAMTAVAVTGLVAPNLRVEIEAWAARAD